jgi:hypothetical protein
MIIILPGNAAYNDLNSQPMVAYRNLLVEGTIAGALVPADAPRADAATEDTSEFWGPTAASDLVVTFAQNEAAHLAYFDAHSMASDSRTIKVERLGASRTNLILRSEELDNASWTKTRATITANATAAPDGELIADKLVEDASAGTSHFAIQTVTLAANQSMTLSAYFKAAERNEGRITCTGGAGSMSVGFNLAAETITPLTTGDGVVSSVALENVGAGWYRVSVTGTPSASGATVTFQVFLIVGGTAIYNGDNTSGLFVWGAQLELGAGPTSYIRTTTASVASVWYDITTWLAPETDGSFMVVFPEVSTTGYRFSVSGACQIGVAWIGPRLVIPGGVVPDYEPIWAAARITKLPAVSRRGHFRGQRIERSGASLSAQFMPIPHDFALNDMAEFRKHFNEGKAFIWASAPRIFLQDVAYCWADQDATLSQVIRAGGDLVNFSMQMEAYVGR